MAWVGNEPSWLASATEQTRGCADLILDKFDDGMSVAQIAREAGVQKSVVEWWLAIARMPLPYSGSELLELSDRGLFASEIAHRFGGYFPVMVRRLLRTARNDREIARQFAEVFG